MSRDLQTNAEMSRYLQTNAEISCDLQTNCESVNKKVEGMTKQLTVLQVADIIELINSIIPLSGDSQGTIKIGPT